MPTRLRALWSGLLESLWFVPAIVGAMGIALAVAMLDVSAHTDPEALARFPRLFGASASSSRSLLSGIASSVITVAGVTFSLTMVAVTQASGQFTPRVLRTFMRDRPTQVVLGIFVAIFAYCLVVLRTVRGADESRFVPSIAIVVAIVLALGSMGALIFFVHHIATTLQATHLAERVGRDTIHAIDRLFPEDIGVPAPMPDDTVLAALASASWYPVAARGTGYLRTIDDEKLARLADSCGIVVRLAHHMGDFIIEGTPIASMSGVDDIAGSDGERHTGRRADLDRRIAAAFTVGTSRTMHQDAAFGVRQLVDIALKALSPGVNDATTAAMCVDWLGAVLVRMADRRVETPFRMKAGRVCVVASGPTFQRLLDLAVDEIRQNADGNVAVLAHLIETLGRVLAATRSEARRRAIRDKIQLVTEHIDGHVHAPRDRDVLRALAREAVRESEGEAAAT